MPWSRRARPASVSSATAPAAAARVSSHDDRASVPDSLGDDCAARCSAPGDAARWDPRAADDSGAEVDSRAEGNSRAERDSREELDSRDCGSSMASGPLYQRETCSRCSRERLSVFGVAGILSRLIAAALERWTPSLDSCGGRSDRVRRAPPTSARTVAARAAKDGLRDRPQPRRHRAAPAPLERNHRLQGPHSPRTLERRGQREIFSRVAQPRVARKPMLGSQRSAPGELVESDVDV